MRNQSKSPFFRQYNLAHPRHNHTQIKEPVEHQKKALSSLHNWYRTSHSPRPAGALLVLPPGGGKTFTTMRFLCTGPLSDGYKVLWLAHTHHLLEQALDSLGTIDGAGEFSAITSTKNTLNARVVSGTQGHFRLAHVDPSDDFLIGTLQTFSQGYKKNHSKLQQWIKAAKGKLVVVFDEAHHAPATTYSEFICNLREQIPGLKLLGLTATPTYTDKTKLGWFDALFPQHIQYQISNTELIAAGVLAVPDIQVQPTNITPDFDPIRCAQWARTFTDLPEDIVTNLAANANRNNSIADHYLANRNSFGKTIIFCDRWAQCEYIRKRLERGGVRAGAVYCHKDASPSTPEARNARSSSENAEKIESFKRGELDVLLNVRMLTEGTDVPAVQTVFLTRQTTSQILITQMVGRAMRGPRFGGTKTAQIVSFIDNWQQQVQWATFAQPQPGPMASGLAQRTSGRVTLVPIELVRRLSMMMQDGTGSTALSFKSFMPVGWYVTSFPVQRENEDTDWIEQFVLVYEEDAPQFDALLSAFMQRDLASFQSNTDTCDMEQSVDRLKDEFFPAQDGHVGSVLSRDISALIRHTAHHGGPPTLVTFAQRDEHNLDELAQQFLRENVGVADLQARLYSEYQRTDRLWSLLFRSYDSFDTQYYQAQKRLFAATRSPQYSAVPSPAPLVALPANAPQREPAQVVKDSVLARDRFCKCCGVAGSTSNPLNVDHIVPVSEKEDHREENLQALCAECNRKKGTRTMDFSTHQTQLLRPPPFQWMPLPDRVSDRDAWEQYIRRSINLYYRCGAVKSVQIGASRGQPWTIELHAGNRPEWIQSNTAAWAKQIQKACSFSMTPGPGELIVSAERGTQQASSGPARKAHSSSPGKARGGSSNVVSSPDKNQCVRRNLSKVSQVVAASVWR